MTWHWRRRRPKAAPATPPEREEKRMITTADEIIRAQTAARMAALHLQNARDRRPEVDATAARIEQVNRENGFAELIRQAFGS
jgi:hypothetical protein